MKWDKGVVYIICAALCLVLFVALFNMYGRSTYERENVINDYNDVTQHSMHVPIVSEVIRSRTIDRLDVEVATAVELEEVEEENEKAQEEYDKKVDTNAEAGEKICQAAEIVWDKYIGMHWGYTQAQRGVKGADCSYYVGDVLVTAGLLNSRSELGNTSSADSNLRSHGFTVVATGVSTADVQNVGEAGDIMLRNGHIEIYAGNNMKYNWGGSGPKEDLNWPYKVSNPSYDTRPRAINTSKSHSYTLYRYTG